MRVDVYKWVLAEALTPLFMALVVFLALYLDLDKLSFVFERNFASGDLMLLSFVLVLSGLCEFEHKCDAIIKNTKRFYEFKFISILIVLLSSVLFYMLKRYSMEFNFPEEGVDCFSCVNKATFYSWIGFLVFLVSVMLLLNMKKLQVP